MHDLLQKRVADTAEPIPVPLRVQQNAPEILRGRSRNHPCGAVWVLRRPHTGE